MSTRKKMRRLSLLVALFLAVLLAAPALAEAAQAPVPLGSTSTFAVLAHETITNTGPTTIGGDAGDWIGVSPGSAITGFPPGLSGEQHSNDATAIKAMTDLVTAYNNAASRETTRDLTGQDLGGLRLTPGVYSFSSSAHLTGTLILDAQGDPDGVFVFKIGSTLVTASESAISLRSGARYCRIFWQVGSSATLGTNSHFVGHIFALASITANTHASVQGQLLALNGAVTLDSNEITNGICANTPTTTSPPTTSPPTTSPITTTTSSPITTTTSSTTTTTTSSTTTTTTPASSTTTTHAPTTTTTHAPTTTTTIHREEFPNTGMPWYYILFFAAGALLLVGAVSRWRTSR